MHPLAKLDVLVAEQLARIPVPPDVQVSFQPNKLLVGDGHFTVTFSYQGILCAYERSTIDVIEMRLELGDDEVSILPVPNGNYLVNVNYRHCPVTPSRDFDDIDDEDEEDEAEAWKSNSKIEKVPQTTPFLEGQKASLEISERLFHRTTTYLRDRVPALIELMQNYYSHKLLPENERPESRQPLDVLKKFDAQL